MPHKINKCIAWQAGRQAGRRADWPPGSDSCCHVHICGGEGSRQRGAATGWNACFPWPLLHEHPHPLTPPLQSPDPSPPPISPYTVHPANVKGENLHQGWASSPLPENTGCIIPLWLPSGLKGKRGKHPPPPILVSPCLLGGSSFV